MRARTRAFLRHSFLSVAGRLPRLTSRGAVRIFCGHHMEAEDADAFRRILRLLREEFELVSLSRAVEIARSPEPPAGRFAALTFDDGFLDNYEHIAAILKEFKASACFFVASNFIDCDEAYRVRFLIDRVHQPLSRRAMSWDMLRELVKDGFEVGAHTADHFNMAQIPLEDAKAQILESKRAIERRLEIPCPFFAWPFGQERDYPRELIDFAREHFLAIFSATRKRLILDHGGFVIHRDHFEPCWPVSHVRYFL